MKTRNKLVYYLLCAYIILTPIIPNGLDLTIIPKLHKIEPLGNVILALLVLAFIKTVISNFNEFKNNLHNFITDFLGLSMLALLAIMVISISYASYKMIALTESARFLSFILLYFIVKYNVGKEEVKGLINSFIFIFSAVNVYGIIQKLTGIGILRGYAIPGTNVLRTNATFDNPNTFAAFLIIGAFPVLMMVIRSKNIAAKISFSIIFIMTLLNIGFTGSRNSYLALVVGGVILSLIYSWRFLGGIVGLAVIALIVPITRTRLLQSGSSAIDGGRIKLWETALKMIQNHPILGVGNGNFIKLYDSYVAKYKYLRYLNYSDYPTHNNYLKIESELGIIGGLSFLGVIVISIVKVKKLINVLKDKDLKLFYSGFLATIIAFFFMNLFENLFTVPEVVAYFWLFLASADALLYRGN